MNMDLMEKQLKQPPQSINAEKAVLGGLMLNPEIADEVFSVLTEKDFYIYNHQIIFNAIHKCINESKPVDPVTLGEMLESEDEFIITYLIDLMNETPSAVNCVHYAKIVSDKSTERQIINKASKVIDDCYNGKKTTEQVIQEAESLMMDIRPEVENDIATAKESLKSMFSVIEENMNSKGGIIGLPTGYVDVDKRLKGYRAGNLVVIAGRPSMGKSTALTNIAENCVLNKKLPFLLFTLEMSKEEVMMRITSSAGSIPLQNLMNGNMTEFEVQEMSNTATRLMNVNLFIDDNAGLSIDSLCSKARRIKSKHPNLAGIGIDYIQLMSSKEDSRERQIAEITRRLKVLAKELELPVIALSQLSRKVEERTNKRPLMSDLRESGAIEQDADIIHFLYRDEVYNPDSMSAGVAEFITSKFRNGRTGTDNLASQLAYSRFRDLASEYKEEKSETY